MARTPLVTGVDTIRAVLGEPPHATVILTLADGPLRRDALAHALAAHGVAATWRSDEALAQVLRQLSSDGTIRRRSTTADYEPSGYELTGHGRERSRIIGLFYEKLAGGCSPSR